jgi:hypothetical protein
MTKEEYFATPWQRPYLDIRAVDASGLEFYYPDRLNCDDEQHWYLSHEKGEQYDPDDVADWWRESLQTHEEYLELQNQINE